MLNQSVVINNFKKINCYRKLASFFGDIKSNEKGYKYEIIMPRKAVGLLKIFLDGEEMKCDIMTPKSFILYIDSIADGIIVAEKKRQKSKVEEFDPIVRIVDDILLHGRTLNAFIEEIVDMLVEKTGYLRDCVKQYIDIEVFAQSKDDECLLKEENYHYLHSYTKISDQSCKKLSDVIMDTFYGVPVSNTSIIPNFKCKRFDLYQYETLKNKIVTADSNWKLFDLDKEEKESIFRKNVLQKGLHCAIVYRENGTDSDWEDFQCVRIYYNDKNDVMFMIPYVFLNQMTQKQLDDNYEKLIDADEIFNLGKVENQKKYRKHYGELKFELLTCLRSIQVGHMFMKEFNLGQDQFEIDRSIMELSYGKVIAERIEEISLGKQEIDFSFGVKSQIQKEFFCDENLKAKYDNIVEDNKDKRIYQILEKYFYENGNYDDEQAQKGIKTRSNGLMLDYMSKKMLEEFENYKNEFYCSLLSNMDRGVAALTIHAYLGGDETHIYSSKIQSGEQAYRMELEEMLPILYFQSKLRNECNKRFIDMDTQEHLIKEYKEIVDSDKVSREYKEIYKELEQKNDVIQRSEEELKNSSLYFLCEEKYKECIEKMQE